MNKKLLIPLIVVIVLLLGGVTYLAIGLTHQRQVNKDMQELADLDKKEMENEYEQFARQYSEMKTQINNDSIVAQLTQEQLKTQRLLEELRQVKSTDAREIARLKKELATVRAVLRSYVLEIDSLNRINQQLTSENQSVKKKYNEATQQISSLSEEKKTLNEKVTLASQLDATHITVTPTNKRGKKTDRIKRITRLDISFTVVKNITAETGQRTLYVRITKPNQEVLTKSAANTFPYENRNIAYSIKKYIEYTGEEQNVTVYWNVEEFLQAGTYRVDIFADGNLIGSQTFDLD